MNKTMLEKSAEKLERLLHQYAIGDAEVGVLLDALAKIISDARAGKISTPLAWREIPGAIWFSEGHLRKYGDLEAAFAEFRIEVTGGESPVLRKLRLGDNS